jgi:purine-binding chemotaxis protein CheW
MPNREPLHGDGGETRQFATFQVGELFFGIEAVRVQEVIRSQEMTEIPLAPAAIKGLINLRGQIVAAVDTRCTLGLPLADAEKQPMNIIIHTEDGAVSLLVDEIGDVLEVPIHSFAPVPDNVPAPQRDLIAGVYRLKDRLMLSLDTAQLLEHACH